MRIFTCLWLLLLLLSPGLCAQPQLLHRVYLIGNTEAGPIPGELHQALQQQLATEQQAYTLLHLGDVLPHTELTAPTGADGQHTLKQLLALGSANSLGKLLLVPGDKDWGNSRQNGLQRLHQLEKLLAKELGYKAMFPASGCPGPEVLHLAPGLKLIAINSPWWTHPFDKPAEPDTDCPHLTSEEMLEELEDLLTDTGNENLLLAAHHPLVSVGPYGGHMPLSKHVFPLADVREGFSLPLPVLGSFYAAYRQNVGTPRDMASPGYQAYLRQIGQLVREHSPLVHVAAHDYSLQLTRHRDSYQLVSGSVSATDYTGSGRRNLYRSSSHGFSRLDYHADGSVWVYFFTLSRKGQLQHAFQKQLYRSPCHGTAGSDIPVNPWYSPCPPDAPARQQAQAVLARPDTVVVPGPQYEAGKARTLFFGTLYRDSWTQPVRVRYLDLASTEGGLTPIGRGGGRQTKSLKLQAADGYHYVFRSVDKDPVLALPPELRPTFIRHVIRETTATAQPYSGLVLASLLDSTNILHARPRLFILPDDPALGPFRQEYAHLLGTLEDRPKKTSENQPGFEDADKVSRSFKMYRQLYKDNDNTLDAPTLARARVFDMYVGDFGRHEDNWKWAGYKTDKGIRYHPIPRDRDQSMPIWNGLLPWLADREWAVPSIQHFGEEMTGIRSLNWPARHLDRFLLTSIDRQGWQQAAHYIQTRMTDATIDSALARLPAEVQPLAAGGIRRKLRSRRAQLPQAVDTYYLMLAREVDVVGTNKHELFQVQRLPDGNVRVQVFKKKKESELPEPELLFDRTFVRGETKEIRLYGLDGHDMFRVTGQSRRSIKVRIIGGPGTDYVVDSSQVGGWGTFTKVYDNTDTRLQLGPEAHNLTSDKPYINDYDRTAFAYNTYTPVPSFIFNRSDGFGGSFGLNFKRHRFRKPDFSALYSVYGQATVNGNAEVGASALWRHVLGKWDVGTDAAYGKYFQYYNFFGLGNATVNSRELEERDYYRARFGGIRTGGYLQHQFWQRSTIKAGPLYEQYFTDYPEVSLLAADSLGRVNKSRQKLPGMQAGIDIDLRDHRAFTRRGLRVNVSHASYSSLTQGNTLFGITEGSVQYYGTANLLLPVTLALKGGGGKNYGRDIPFYKYTSLGLRENLRGYLRNRFTGDGSVYFNSELRFHLGQTRGAVLPLYFGILGFHDQGRVYFNGRSEGGWHRGYGTGFYLAPIAESMAMSVTFQRSREERMLLQVTAGFRIDK